MVLDSTFPLDESRSKLLVTSPTADDGTCSSCGQLPWESLWRLLVVSSLVWLDADGNNLCTVTAWTG